MALEGQQSIVPAHSLAIVGDADELASAGLDLDADASRSRVQRVLQQLLHNRRRSLHHLARCDLVSYLVRQYADSAHLWIVVSIVLRKSGPKA